jgi:hypothetical protein
MPRFTRRYLLLAATGVVLATGFAQSGDSTCLNALPAGDRWIRHLAADLLPFCTGPAARGNPVG